MHLFVVSACVCRCARVRVHAFRMVSTDQILRIINALMIIILRMRPPTRRLGLHVSSLASAGHGRSDPDSSLCECREVQEKCSALSL